MTSAASAPASTPGPAMPGPVLNDPTLAGACDCHVHINDPRYPYAAGADLHPPAATVAQYRQVQARLGTDKVVIVQPSSYGLDNRCTLEAVAQFGLTTARAVVVIDPATTPAQIAQMHAQGARGVRVNLLRPSPVSAGEIHAIARLIAPFGWHLQLHASADQILSLSTVLQGLPVAIVFDHLARLPGQGGASHPAFALVAGLLRQGRAWLKVSGAELDGAVHAPAYAQATQVARHFVELAPERLVWGSNWPHPATHVQAEPAPDDAALLRWLFACAPDEPVRRQILLTNADTLYGFNP